MSPLGEVLVGITIIVAAFGTFLPILPGVIMAGIAILVWCFATGGAAAWGVGLAATAILVASQVLKYLIPGKHLSNHDVPPLSILVGGAAGIAGFFLIPVVGIFVGFVAGVYAAEFARLRSASSAWPSTKAAIKATGLSILIELCAVLGAGAIWFGAVVLT